MEKNKAIITGLSIAVVILAVIVVYAFILSPSISGYAVDRRNEGAQIAVIQIAQLAAQCQPIPVPLDVNGSQTLNLIAMECFPDRFPELNQQTQQTGEQTTDGGQETTETE